MSLGWPLARFVSRRSKQVALLVVSVIAVAMLGVSITTSNPRLVWNFTPSIPTGLYIIEDRDWRRDDRVALKPSGHLLELLRASGVLKDGRLLMKRVAADAGDEVCRKGQEVTINGVAAALARQDQLLPSWSGCHVLEIGDVFLLGDADNSFDGRYFGVSSAVDIVGPVHSIMTF